MRDTACILVERELARWARQGRKANLWWRDDDAQGRTPELDRLLGLSEAFAAPVTLAVLPTPEADSLAPRLVGSGLVTVVQHGLDHRDHGGMGPCGEFPDDWTADRLPERLAASWARLSALPGAFKAFTPACNAVHPQLPPTLASQGYLALSAAGRLPAGGGAPPRLDVHMDVLPWRAGPWARGARDLLGAFAQELSLRRSLDLWTQPIGLLSHHLDHDEAAWRALSQLLSMTADHPAIAWEALPALVEMRFAGASRSEPFERRWRSAGAYA